MKTPNIFNPLPEDLSEEVFETILQTRDLKIERIISDGQSSPPTGWHCQKRDEWVILLQGKATLLFENNQTYELSLGDHLLIPAHTKHRVTHTEPKTIWLAVHYTIL